MADAVLPTPTDCARAVRLVWDYLDGRLPPPDREGISVHLATCAECTGHYRFERGFLERLRERRLADPDADALRDRIAAALRREQA